MADEKSKTINFNNEGINNLPKNKPVVYKILNKNSENIYTGISKRGEIQNRLKDHLPRGKDLIPGGVKVQIQQKKSIDDARKFESLIISKSKPRHNKKGK